MMKGAFAGCKWCDGSGCLACQEERTKAEQRAMEPIFTADTNNPHDMQLCKDLLGRGAIECAFGPDGGGIEEVKRNAAIASFLQAVRVIPDESYGEAVPA